MAIIGFIGTGNMGGALALAAGRNTEGDRILLYDKDKQTALRISHGIPRSRVTERDELVETAHYIFIGVKPQMLQGLFDEIRPALKRRDEAREEEITRAVDSVLEAAEHDQILTVTGDGIYPENRIDFGPYME